MHKRQRGRDPQTSDFSCGVQPSVTQQLWGPLKEALEAALKSYGAGVVLLVLAVVYLFYQNNRGWQDRLKDKDDEIKRMAKEKERLEKIVLKNRLSTGLGGSDRDNDDGDDAKEHRRRRKT